MPRPKGGVPYDPNDPSTWESTSPPNTGAIDKILNTNAPDTFNDTTNQTVHSGVLNGVYYIYYPADDEHGEQLAVPNSDGSTTWYVNDGDTPRYGGGGSLQSNPACDNPGEDIWVTQPTVYTDDVPDTPPTGPQITIRTQTWGIRSAIQGAREAPLKLLTAIATTPMRGLVLDATIAGNPTHDFLLSSTIRGTPEKEFKLKSAIRKIIDAPIKMTTAIAHDFEIAPKIDVAIQGSPWVHTHLDASIQGEAEKAFTVSAIILKDRAETIYLEMENLFPQECDLRGIPNAPSKFKDWRKTTFGQ